VATKIPDDDPITSKSYALPYLIASVVLIGTLLWALWDENYAQRPWKTYQKEFAERYSAFLKTAVSSSSKDQKQIENSSEYKQLDDAYKSAAAAADAQVRDIKGKASETDAHLAAVQAQFTDAKAHLGADTYSVETGTFDQDNGRVEEKEHQDKLAKLNQQKQVKQYEVDYPSEKGNKYSYNELEELYNKLRLDKADWVAKLALAMKPQNEAKAKRDQYVTDHLTSLSAEQIKGIRDKYDEWYPQIRQVNVLDTTGPIPGSIVVDRCESCHMGTREPLTLTAAALTPKGQKPDFYSRAFVTHPSPELLQIHDPEKFGCSPCHNGNGRATTSMEKAHGEYEHWLWPLYHSDRKNHNSGNIEAGCQTCHSSDMFLATNSGVGATINEGKTLFQLRGCMGCHRYEGYDREPEELTAATQQIRQFEAEIKDNQHQIEILRRKADDPNATNEEAQRYNQLAEALLITDSKNAGQIETLDFRSKSLLRDVKKIGPNLKEIRAKLNKNWIPVWIHKPTDFRPSTRMPNFRLNDDQVRSIAAYLWQSALPDSAQKAPTGNADHGQQLFETRGCMACHSMGSEPNQIGGPYANLTRVGEKVNYDYLVRWIKNPRQRLRPYCPYEKKDIGQEDYAKKGLPYVIDADHSKCPNDGHELQWQQTTIMPILRLSDQDAADIATYLIGKKAKEPTSYADASFMDDPKLKADGQKWIRNFGCAGCHEISGFEDEGRIGTELTVEGSKPIERLDFAMLTTPAERGVEPFKDPGLKQLDASITDPNIIMARLPQGPATDDWYSLKGFFEHKLAMPNIYDKGKIKGDMERLRMPDPHLNAEQIRALVTFLLGSQETSLPDQYQYKPQDYRHDIQEGWWVVEKYGCKNCHQFTPGQKTVLMDLPQYRDVQEKLPPKLLTEGARVDPDWLLRFLNDPSLTGGKSDNNRNGVRTYLDVRMPTFNLSPEELRKLVKFFQAMARQPMPYIPQKPDVLTAKEVEMGRSLFSSQAAPCLKCHATGDAAHDKTATAPNFLLAKDRLKPGWTERWIIDPQSISPGTAMPSGLFRDEKLPAIPPSNEPRDHWVFNGPLPPSFAGYTDDQTKLLVRYIFQLTPEEQRAVSSKMPKTTPAAGAKTSAVRKAKGGASGAR
jgi:cytochrome c551/c552